MAQLPALQHIAAVEGPRTFEIGGCIYTKLDGPVWKCCEPARGYDTTEGQALYFFKLQATFMFVIYRGDSWMTTCDQVHRTLGRMQVVFGTMDANVLEIGRHNWDHWDSRLEEWEGHHFWGLQTSDPSPPCT